MATGFATPTGGGFPRTELEGSPTDETAPSTPASAIQEMQDYNSPSNYAQEKRCREEREEKAALKLRAAGSDNWKPASTPNHFAG